jgi:hypothetical protein
MIFGSSKCGYLTGFAGGGEGGNVGNSSILKKNFKKRSCYKIVTASFNQ